MGKEVLMEAVTTILLTLLIIGIVAAVILLFAVMSNKP
jgi:hypothetical protein